MLDFSWKVFSMTGNIDTYLLLKEIEKDADQTSAEYAQKLDELDTTNS